MAFDLTPDWSTVSEIALPLLIGVAYFVRIGHLRDDGRQPSRARQASFAGGLVLIVIATIGPMDSLADDFVFAHMVQHTMLMDEAGLLLVIGLASGPRPRPVDPDDVSVARTAAPYQAAEESEFLDRAHGIAPLDDRSTAGAVLMFRGES